MFISENTDYDLPTLFVVEGEFHYFKEEDVIFLIQKLQKYFKDADILFNVVDEFGINYVRKYVKKQRTKVQ